MELLSVSVIAFSSLFSLVHPYSIDSETQAAVVRTGESVTLNCVISGSDYNPVDNPNEWVKMQTETDTAGLTLATLRRTKGVFGSSGRFSITGSGNNDFSLTITDLQVEDSGWYRCQIEEGGSITASRKHKVSVITPIESVVLFGFTNTDDMPEVEDLEMTTNTSLSYKENVRGYFECRVVGGYPEPIVVRMLLDDKQITGSIDNKKSTALVGDTVGLQKIVYTTRVFHDSFQPTAENDGKTLTCRAEVKVNGVTESQMEASSMLNIKGSPVFKNCSSEVQFPMGSTGASIVCTFFAKPEFTAVSWQGITTGDIINGTAAVTNAAGYMAVAEAITGEYMYKATLQFPKLTLNHFQMYKLSIGNAIGEKSTTIKLKQGPGPSDGEVRDAAFCCSPSIFTTALLLLFLRFILQ